MQMAKEIPAEIFRAYDIRGIVGQTLTPEIVYSIGLAFGSEAKDLNEKQVIIARDGRLSGAELLNALQAGLLASGCDVINIGALPTPLLYFATKIFTSQSGIMLTGSHNPPDYNGLKMVLAGTTLSETAIQRLYQRLLRKDFSYGAGQVSQQNIIAAYINAIKQDITLKRPLRVVIDAGSGIAGAVAPQLYQSLGCEVIELYCEVDGNFPHHHPDPSQLENLYALQQAVQQHQADVGLAFDGDGDRLGVITDTGEVIWPDRQMMLFAQDVLARNPSASILFDVKCSRLLPAVIKHYSGQPLMCKTGHSFVKAQLQETGALLAGEMSGHIFFKERWFGFDDGLYAGARLLEILAGQDQPLSELFRKFPDSLNTPELKIPIAEQSKFNFMQALITQADFPLAEINTLDGLRVDFADGWGLVRPSNTTPCLVLRFEADSKAALTAIQNQFRRQLLAIDSSLVLPF